MDCNEQKDSLAHAAEFFEQARSVKLEIDVLKHSRQSFYDLNKRAGLGRSDEAYKSLMELSAANVHKLQKKLLHVQATINKLENETHRAILTAYYINGLTWEQISEKMYISLRHAYRLRKEALREAAKILNGGKS